jgi:glutathione synthase/RimK-type ligase-like ATP-grasp enzyme
MIQRALAPLEGHSFTLSIYFGRNLAKRYDRLSMQLFNLFRAPLLRASFIREKEWRLQTISIISMSDVPDAHHDFLIQAATDFFAVPQRVAKRKKNFRYKLAILCNPEDKTPPSDARALRKFIKAAEQVDMGAKIIGKDDINRLAEYDALFIRETTWVNNHTYRFARRAEAEGLVVIDDSQSIVRCTNKVYLAELMRRHSLCIPRSLIVHRENVRDVLNHLSLPLVLKQPDSSFSAGVSKVETERDLREQTRSLLNKSELIIAQEYLPTEFDWRVGVLDQQPLYVCKYFMAKEHWQIVDYQRSGKIEEGPVETLAVEEAPEKVVKTALRAARLIGDGFYGVDLKVIKNKCYVIEINDNPSIEAGYEDAVLKDDLYLTVMRVFRNRIEATH